jgi:tetratricopeptide (TPR) repeat protein
MRSWPTVLSNPWFRHWVSRKGLWVACLSLCFMAVCFGYIQRAWSANRYNISLLRVIAQPCDEFESSTQILCSTRQGALAANWMEDASEGCQFLWLSRIQAAQSLSSAQAALERGAGCTRQSLVSAWGGELAWLLGDRRQAESWWRQLNTSQLLSWGYSLLLSGDLEQGISLLALAVQRGAEHLSVDQKVEALSKLGFAYRLAGNWPEAIDAYESAYRLAPDDTEIVLGLAVSYRQSGQAEEAIRVLEGGLDDLPPLRYDLVSSFYVHLGLAYREIGDEDRAVKAFRQAITWLQMNPVRNLEQEEFIQRLLDRTVESNDVND